MPPSSYGPGVAEHLTGTHLMFNLHYQANGQATTDKTRVGIWLAEGSRHARDRRGLAAAASVTKRSSSTARSSPDDFPPR